MMDYDWHSLDGDKHRYQVGFFSEGQFGKRFNRLSHEYMLITVASHGGRIALTSDKKQILTLRDDDPSIENICLFSNDGQLHSRIKLRDPFKNVVICLQFLQDELLMALFQNGDIWLISPYDGSIVFRRALGGLYEKQEVVEAKTFNVGLAVRTSMQRFLFTNNAQKPQCLEFAYCQELKNGSNEIFWKVFSSKGILSQKVELQACHPYAGIVQLIESESKKSFFFEHTDKGLPCIKGIRYISELSPNQKLMAYFVAEPLEKDDPTTNSSAMKKNPKIQAKQIYGYAYRIVVAPSINSDVIDPNKFRTIKLAYIRNQHVGAKKCPLAMKWCGNKALVTQYRNQQLYLHSIDGDFTKIEKERADKDKWSFLKEQIDGVRIITSKENKILRPIPSAYINVFESFSEESGALLYAAYQAFQDEAPLQDDHIRREKSKLAAGVDQCIKCSRFELNFDVVCKLLKAATYGKAFLPPYVVANNAIFNTSKVLRIVNHLRQQGRYITLEQFEAMNDEQKLMMLLRNKDHYLAFEIYTLLKKDENFRTRIYVDWACCKVQSSLDSEDLTCEEIREKLKNEKGVSFTEIAHKAIQIGKSDLAMKLLEYEPSLSKKVPLLLWIGSRESIESCKRFYEKGVQEAVRSRDLNLLFLAIGKILRSEKLGQFEIFEMFTSSPVSRHALLNYYRIFDGSAMIKYCNYLNANETLIMEYIRRGIIDRKYENTLKLLNTGNDLLKGNDQGDWRKNVLDKLVNHLAQFVKHNPHAKSKDHPSKPVTLSKQFEFFVSKGDGEAIEDMKKLYRISDKRAIMTKVKHLLDTQKYQDLINYLEKHQKTHKIPAQLIAGLLLDRKQPTWALKMMAKMPSKQKEEQYLLLQRIGRIREAIDLAADRSDFNALEDIKSTLVDQQLRAHLETKLASIRKK